MKKPYQIEAQRAVNRLEEMAAEGNPAVQMVLPMAEMVGWLRKGVGELVRQAGLQLMSLLMDEEVRKVAGERSRPQPERTANRETVSPHQGTQTATPSSQRTRSSYSL